jgi:hypothetical protein
MLCLEQGDQIEEIIMGNCLIWVVFRKITELSHIFNYFSTEKVVILLFNLDHKWFGLPFEQYFHKLVWSPWFRDTLVRPHPNILAE